MSVPVKCERWEVSIFNGGTFFYHHTLLCKSTQLCILKAEGGENKPISTITFFYLGNKSYCKLPTSVITWPSDSVYHDPWFMAMKLCYCRTWHNAGLSVQKGQLICFLSSDSCQSCWWTASQVFYQVSLFVCQRHKLQILQLTECHWTVWQYDQLDNNMGCVSVFCGKEYLKGRWNENLILILLRLDHHFWDIICHRKTETHAYAYPSSTYPSAHKHTHTHTHTHTQPTHPHTNTNTHTHTHTQLKGQEIMFCYLETVCCCHYM